MMDVWTRVKLRESPVREKLNLVLFINFNSLTLWKTQDQKIMSTENKNQEKYEVLYNRDRQTERARQRSLVFLSVSWISISHTSICTTSSSSSPFPSSASSSSLLSSSFLSPTSSSPFPSSAPSSSSSLLSSSFSSSSSRLRLLNKRHWVQSTREVVIVPLS